MPAVCGAANASRAVAVSFPDKTKNRRNVGLEAGYCYARESFLVNVPRSAEGSMCVALRKIPRRLCGMRCALCLRYAAQRTLRALWPDSFRIKTKNRQMSVFCFGGGSWIRTSEVSDNRFTVCPLWPLGNSPQYMELVIGVEPTTC